MVYYQRYYVIYLSTIRLTEKRKILMMRNTHTNTQYDGMIQIIRYFEKS